MPRAGADGRSLQHLLSPEAPVEMAACELVADSPGLIVGIDSFLTADECAALISAAAALGLQPARPDDLRPRKGEAFINRETLVLVDAPLVARLWSRLLPHLPPVDGREPVGLQGDSDGAAAQLKFYRYRRGHRFGAHVDTSHRGAQTGEMTEFTLLVYLNSAGEAVAGEPADDANGGGVGPAAGQPLLGGDTVFMRTAKAELTRVSPRQGLGLLHAHGRRCCMHEAEEVVRGAKYVLRADVLYRRIDQQQQSIIPTPGRASEARGGGGGRRKGGR